MSLQSQIYQFKEEYYKTNGGKKIVLDNGKTIEGGSVWQNLNKTIL